MSSVYSSYSCPKSYNMCQFKCRIILVCVVVMTILVCVVVMTGYAKPTHCFSHTLSPTFLSRRIVWSNCIVQYSVHCWYILLICQVRVCKWHVSRYQQNACYCDAWHNVLFILECNMLQNGTYSLCHYADAVRDNWQVRLYWVAAVNCGVCRALGAVFVSINQWLAVCYAHIHAVIEKLYLTNAVLFNNDSPSSCYIWW